jgi:UDP-GlcNAc:undecaprenyl-phosphate GlcNAc-1-phosphate transferase
MLATLANFAAHAWANSPLSLAGPAGLDAQIESIPMTSPAIEPLPLRAVEDGALIGSATFGALEFLNGYAGVFIVAFLVTLISTPFVRKLAIEMEIIDKPNEARKQHKYPIAYLGGFAVFLGVMAAIAYSYAIVDGPGGALGPMPLSIVIGIVAITFTGLADDVWGWDPRLKIAGQLVAAAALAVQDIGTRVAEGVLAPVFGEPQTVLLTLGPMALQSGDIFYWTGTAIIALFVLGGCNAMNLIDGLDGLCSGTAAIQATALLAIALIMAAGTPISDPFESLAGVRIVLCLALLGAVLGFLPWNFNPAVIFLGDCGSLLIGYLVVVSILMLGEQGDTHLVFAGLIIFALPIMDTSLAILRRKLAGVPMSTADANHIHHIVKRAVGGVKRAVFTLYAISFSFGILGVVLGALAIEKLVRLRIVYAVSIVLFGAIAAIALKVALRSRWQAHLEQPAAAPAGGAMAIPVTAAVTAEPQNATPSPTPSPSPSPSPSLGTPTSHTP